MHHVTPTCLLLLLLNSSSVFASSDAECGIWMCAPTGFSTGCSDSKKAFKHRIKHFKPPLPSFMGCMVDSGYTDESGQTSLIQSKEGSVAYSPRYDVCTRRNERTCLRWKHEPSKLYKNKRCTRDSRDHRSPTHCTATYRYVEMWMDGQRYGEAYFYNKYGEVVTADVIIGD